MAKLLLLVTFCFPQQFTSKQVAHRKIVDANGWGVFFDSDLGDRFELHEDQRAHVSAIDQRVKELIERVRREARKDVYQILHQGQEPIFEEMFGDPNH